MSLFNFLFLLTLLGSGFAANSKIVFTKPDINATVNYVTGPVFVEAFKSAQNDQILKETNVSKYGDLSWYSLGAPKLHKTLCTAVGKKFLFHLSGRGFHTFVDSLKIAQKRFLAEEASTKYEVPVSPMQIKSIPISRIACRMYFNNSANNRTQLIKGTGVNLEMDMQRLNFFAPSKSRERIAFEQRDNSSPPLKLECTWYSGEIAEKSTPLVIKSAELKRLNIPKKVFGSSLFSVFMTRAQMLNLAGEIYRSLNIMSRFVASESEFSEEFIKLIGNGQQFSLEPLDKVLKNLSKYSLSAKLGLKPDSLRKTSSGLFQVNKSGSNMSVIRRGNQDEALAVLFGKSSHRIVDEYEQDWIEAKRELTAQIYDLNYFVRDEVEWSLEGERIYPAKVAVVKLEKSALEKDLKFLTVNQTIVKADFVKIIALNANF